MAFVTAINGECSAGATPHTTWYPARPASANVARRGTPPSPKSLVYPKARRAHAATLATAAFFTKAARCFSFASTLISSSVSTTDATASFGDVFGGGGLKGVIMSGYLRTPSYATSMFWTASSSRSIWYTPFSFVVWGPTLSMNFATLVPKRDDEVDASRDGRSVYPTIVTPFAVVITSSGTV
jgi:hypothetical protein